MDKGNKKSRECEKALKKNFFAKRYKEKKSVHNLTDNDDEQTEVIYGKETIITESKEFFQKECILHYNGGMPIGDSRNGNGNGADK